MKLDWNKYLGKTLNVTVNGNYGVIYCKAPDKNHAFYEIVLITGKSIAAFKMQFFRKLSAINKPKTFMYHLIRSNA